MNSNTRNQSNQNSQAGMVAIMVTMLLMIVISLIVLGFAQISRRNQRQALDRQLSTQAFYAAETGVNDATDLIKAALASGTTVPAKPDCASTGGGFYSTLTPVIDASTNVEYTCMVVDPAPTAIVRSPVGTTSSVIPLIASSGTIASATFTWTPIATTAVATCPNSVGSVFSAAATPPWNCPYGVLRFDLVPTTGGGLTYASLQNATMTSFVVPLRPGSAGGVASMAYTTGGGNNRFGVVCTVAACSLTITGLTQSQYYVRVSSLYQDVSLKITALSGTGSAVAFQGAQAIIDVTGKAQDVLRRIQVRVPLNGASSNLLSDYAIESTDAICKRFSIMTGYFKSDANAVVPGVGAAHPSNPLCQ